MKKAWRISVWTVMALYAIMVAALILFFEQVDPKCTCDWDTAWLIKSFAWVMLFPLVPLFLWNCFRQAWWPLMVFAVYFSMLGMGVHELVPAHYWGDYGHEACMLARCGDALAVLVVLGFFPAFKCGKASLKSGVTMSVLVVLSMIFLSLL